jgi:uncharacterized protein
MATFNLTDSGKLSSTVITAEGFLVCDIDFARVGVQQYFNSDLGMMFPNKPAYEKINVLRQESEVFDAESMASFSLIPLTNGHPDRFLDANTVKHFQVGTTGESVTRNGQFVRTKIKVTDADIVKKIQSGYKQFSAGYSSVVKPYTAIVDGIQIHAIQTNIRGNHLAVAINNARCGSGCSIKDNKNMKTEKILETIKVELSDELRTALTDSLSSVETEFATLELKVTDAEAKVVAIQELWDGCKKKKEDEIEEIKAQLDDAKSKIFDEAKIDVLVEERVKTISDCQSILPEVDTKLSNSEMKRTVVGAKCADLKDTISVKTAAYIEARFDALVSTVILDAVNIAKAAGQKADKAKLVDSQESRRKAHGIVD